MVQITDIDKYEKSKSYRDVCRFDNVCATNELLVWHQNRHEVSCASRVCFRGVIIVGAGATSPDRTDSRPIGPEVSDFVSPCSRHTSSASSRRAVTRGEPRENESRSAPPPTLTHPTPAVDSVFRSYWRSRDGATERSQGRGDCVKCENERRTGEIIITP